MSGPMRPLISERAPGPGPYRIASQQTPISDRQPRVAILPSFVAAVPFDPTGWNAWMPEPSWWFAANVVREVVPL